MKKLIAVTYLVALSVVLNFTACGKPVESLGLSDSQRTNQNKKAPTSVSPNGQYINEDGYLELPGLDGEIIGDGNLTSFFSASEFEEFRNSIDLGLPKEAFDKADGYTVEIWPSEQTGAKAPQGILVRENDILVADKEGNCIVVLDKNGAAVKTVGTVGNGTEELLRPSGIALNGDKICVLDGGNDRIQILDEQLNFKDKIQLIRPSEKDDFYNIAFDKDGNLYLSRMDGLSQRMYCYKANNSTEPIPIAENACGALAEKNGQVYAVNYGSAYSEGPIPEDKHIFVQRGFGTGSSYLFSASVKQLTQITELPVKMGVSALAANDEGFLLYSDSTARLMQFSAQGVFMHTIAEIPHNAPFGHYLAQAEDGKIYVTALQDSNIYVISPKA